MHDIDLEKVQISSTFVFFHEHACVALATYAYCVLNRLSIGSMPILTNKLRTFIVHNL
jgi:hypothetical protein